MTDPQTNDGSCQQGSASSGRKLWQTALLLAGSAVFGGLAVAFWNRKELAEMRSRTPETAPRNTAQEEDIY